MNIRSLARPLAAGACLVSVLALTSACGGDSGAAADSGEVAIGVYPSSSLSIPAYVGEAAGIFQDHDIEAELINVKSGPELISALLGGSVQVVVGTPATVVPALQQGQEFLSLPTFGYSDYVVQATKQSGITTIDDLPGHTFAVPARGGAVEMFVSELLKERGLDPAKVEFIATGPTSSQIPMLRNGEVDAVVGSYATAQSFKAEGLDLVTIADPLADTAGEVGEYAVGVFFATENGFAEDNPDTTDRLCAAFEEITAWIADSANEVEGTQIVAEATGLSPEAAGEVWTALQGTWTTSLPDGEWEKNVSWVSRNSESKSDAPAPLDSACS